MKATYMSTLHFLALTFMTLLCASLSANALTITNATNEKIKVGLFASALNFSVMTFAAQETREYDSGIAQECVKSITINGTQVWSGAKCENYTLKINKNNDGTFGLTFGASSKPLAPASSDNGLSM